ncbi:MAG: hypothetical protein MR562_11495 [Clostridiaceae bacterium]|nr:hypothetical protein [Clostridiaceae bacterium]
MKTGRKWMIALAAGWIVSTASVSSYGAVITYNSKYSDSTSSEQRKEEKSGPGSQYLDEETEVVEETAEFEGPGVNKVNLIENYHEDYRIYEESIENLFFFYTNVANGGITDEAVFLDIPSNILYSMEKDGAAMEYTSGQSIGARGTYVLRLTAIENPELPLSEQKEYQSVFRFRIQDKPRGAETEEKEIVGSTFDSLPDSSATVLDLEALEEEARQEEPGEMQEEAAGQEEPEETQTEAEEDSPVEIGDASRRQTYDPMLGKYRVTLANGVELISTVPEGYMGPDAVELTVSGDVPSEIELYRNDELQEFVNGNSLMDAGVYRLEAGDEAYSFRIVAQASDLEYYPAPAGMHFTRLFLGDEPQSLPSDQLLVLESDGVYTIFMEGTAGDALEVVLKKDTEAPAVQVTVDGGKAGIEYLSDDITEIVLEKDGSVVDGFHGTMISSPGRYRLTVSDAAGNETAREFVLKYQINLYGVAAVLLCILVIAGGAVFVFHTKRNMKIR